MSHWCPDVLKSAALAGITLALVGPVWAQNAAGQAPPDTAPPGAVSERLDSLGRDTSHFFERIFGPSDRAGREQEPVAVAQMSAPDLAVRLERLENEIRQLTGMVEQLQYRNQQLEQQVRRLTDESDGPKGPRAAQGAPPSAAPPIAAAPPPPLAGPAVIAAVPPAAPGAIPRRGDAFDPSQNPGAPGAPRVLGAVPSNAAPPPGAILQEEPPYVGAPGGRQAGAPLDLSVGGPPANDAAPGAPPGGAGPLLPPPPPRNPNATGGTQQMVMAPSNSPKDEYDLAYGYVLRKDYALAEESFRAFLKKHPSDRLAPDANYWLGETLFQRQRYRDAAESFLTVSTKYETAGKAPDALLRLGQSLAALNEKEAACATLGEIGRKYPRASVTVKQGVEREQKREHC